MADAVMRKGWNPKRVSVKQAMSGQDIRHETSVWCYLSEGGTLDIVVEVNNKEGYRSGTTIHTVRIPT
jgi:hypothetical protein